MFIKSGYHFGYQSLRQNDIRLSVVIENKKAPPKMEGKN